MDLLVKGEKQEEITERQKEAFRCFMEKWSTLQESLIEALIKYYYEAQYYTYDPEDEEAKEWWPEIKTREDLLKAVTLESIVIAGDWMMEKGRRIYLLFSRTWGGEDLEDDGIGVRYINENIDKISYKEIAF